MEMKIGILFNFSGIYSVSDRTENRNVGRVRHWDRLVCRETLERIPVLPFRLQQTTWDVMNLIHRLAVHKAGNLIIYLFS